MKKRDNQINFKALLIIGVIMIVVGLFSLSRNTEFGTAMVVGGAILSLISILKFSKNKKIKKAIGSAWWFLVAGIIFGFSGIRYIIKEDTVGAIINILAAVLFFIVFIGNMLRKK